MTFHRSIAALTCTLSLFLCAAAFAEDAPSGHILTGDERAAAAKAIFDAFKANDADALAKMSITLDEMKVGCPGFFDANRWAEVFLNSVMSEEQVTKAGGPEAALATLRTEHPHFIKDMSEGTDPAKRRAEVTQELEECHALIGANLASLSIQSIEGADVLDDQPGLDKVCNPDFLFNKDLKIILSDGSALELNGPVVINGQVKGAGNFRCQPSDAYTPKQRYYSR